MSNWLVANKDLLFFGQSVFVLAAIYHAFSVRKNGRQTPPSNDKKTVLNVEEIFCQLLQTPPSRFGEVSRGYLGTRVKATGSLESVKKLTDDLMTVCIIPHGVEEGCISTGVPFSKCREIAQSDQDITLEGEISYIELDTTCELCLSHAKLTLAV
jgi:hypothetical protein